MSHGTYAAIAVGYIGRIVNTDREACVARSVAANEVAVDVGIGEAKYTLKVEPYGLALELLRHVKVLPIP